MNKKILPLPTYLLIAASPERQQKVIYFSIGKGENNECQSEDRNHYLRPLSNLRGREMPAGDEK
jgi:hypothetical protein